jgi:hypothetical protein
MRSPKQAPASRPTLAKCGAWPSAADH